MAGAWDSAQTRPGASSAPQAIDAPGRACADILPQFAHALARADDVGQPDAERITWCSRRAERFSLLAYGNLRVWQGRVLEPLRTLKNIDVLAVDQEALANLAQDLPRALSWSVMISDGELFVTDERGQHEIPLQWLVGQR